MTNESLVDMFMFYYISFQCAEKTAINNLNLFIAHWSFLPVLIFT